MTYIHSKNIAVIEIPKTASRSLRSSIRDNLKVSDAGYVPHLTLQQYLNAYPDLRMGVTLIRDPIKRLISAVNFMLGHKVVSMRSPAYDKSVLDEAFEKFNSALQSKKFNNELIYLYPQYSFLLADVPLEIFTIESSGKLLESIGVYSSLPFENKSSMMFSEAQIFESFPLDFIRKAYSIDFALWDMLNSSEERVLRVENAREFFVSLGESNEN